MANEINIGGRLHSVASGNVVAGANEIYDDDRQKKQSEINNDLENAIEAAKVKSASAEIADNDTPGTPTAIATLQQDGNLHFEFEHLKGEPLKFEDLTEAQKAELTGPKGDSVIVGQGDLPMAHVLGNDTKKAMSQQGVTKAVNVIDKKVDGTIDLINNEYDKFDGVLVSNSNLNWADLTSRECILVPVLEGQKVYISQGSGHAGYAAFMANNDAPEVGQRSSAIAGFDYYRESTDTSGIANVLTLATGDNYILVAPQGAHYLYLHVRTGATSFLPERVCVGGLKEDLKETNMRVERIENSPSKGVFDISVYNAQNGVPAIYGTFAQAIAAVPESEQRGGMSVKYLKQGDTVEYVTYRLMSIDWSADASQWQGIDGKSTDLATLGKIQDMLAHPTGEMSIDLSEYSSHVGFIDNNNGGWKTAPNRQYVIVPLGDIKKLDVKANAENPSPYAFLTVYEPTTDTYNGVIDSRAIVLQKGVEVSLTVPDEAEFIYFQILSGDKDYAPEYVRYKGEVIGGYSDILDTQDDHKSRIEALEAGAGVTKGIVQLNNPETMLSMLANAKWNYDKLKKSLVMIHFSDMHGNEENLHRIEEFVNEYNSKIDLVLHTGDLVANMYTHPIYWNHNDKFLLTTGNHDCTYREGTQAPYTWLLADKGTVYGNLFAPFIEDWEVTRPDNATTELYYYKDYVTYGIRLIVMDSYYWDNDEATWLANVLDDAKENDLQIILASHYGPFIGESNPENPFDSLDYNMASGMSDKALPVVDAFIANEGSIICWLCGHMHADGFRMDENHPGILSIAVSAAGQSLTNQEYARPVGTKAQDLFNIYAIDTAKKKLSIIRIGADYDAYMRHKGTLVYDYENHQIISIN